MPDWDTVFSAWFNYLCVLDKNKTVSSKDPVIQMFTLISPGFHFNESKLMTFLCWRFEEVRLRNLSKPVTETNEPLRFLAGRTAPPSSSAFWASV